MHLPKREQCFAAFKGNGHVWQLDSNSLIVNYCVAYPLETLLVDYIHWSCIKSDCTSLIMLVSISWHCRIPAESTGLKYCIACWYTTELSEQQMDDAPSTCIDIDGLGLTHPNMHCSQECRHGFWGWPSIVESRLRLACGLEPGVAEQRTSLDQSWSEVCERVSSLIVTHLAKTGSSNRLLLERSEELVCRSA